MKAISATLGAALLLAACTTQATDDAERAADSRAIGFRTPAVARAVVDDANSAEFTAFDVWGWYAPSGSSDYAPLFGSAGGAGEVVSRTAGTANWGYEGLRYWQDDHMYNFYALFPSKLPNASYAENGTLTITDYDARQNYDLMAAARTGMNGSNPQAVAFTFQHLLANIVFTARTAPAVQQGGTTVTITSFRLDGFPVTCSFNSSSTPPWNINTPERERYNSQQEIGLSDEYTTVADLLVFPQQLGPSLTYEIKYRSSQSTEEEFVQSGRLETVSGSVTRWREGVRYRYTMELGADYILFGKPVIEEWEEISGGRWNVE